MHVDKELVDAWKFLDQLIVNNLSKSHQQLIIYLVIFYIFNFVKLTLQH